MPNFIIMQYVKQIFWRWREELLGPPIREQPQKGPSWIGLNDIYIYNNLSTSLVKLKLP